MKNDRIYLKAPLGAVSLAGAMLALGACADEPVETTTRAAAIQEGLAPLSDLPLVDSTSNPELLAELLERPTALGETTALQVRLPPPHNRELEGSLVRVIGDVNHPHVLFRSDALVQLGVLPKSPGPEFFTAFVTLDRAEIDRLAKDHDELASGVFGEVSNESVVFSGRHPVARTIGAKLDPSAFTIGSLLPLNKCMLVPISTQKAWDQSLFITAKDVVLDPARTWDPCTGAGTKGGVWTFAHLMREMAIGSGLTPENFVTRWLSMWLNPYGVNGDTVPARTQMFNQVIQPWATASGVTATLITNPLTGVKSVSLTGPLNLDIAPFRLEAIVNRVDLGETTGGGGSYGSVTGTPKNPGELRFIFGVVQPNPWGAGTDATCGKKLFTTIFEYGVPGIGCAASVAWAKKWSSLQAFPGFTPAYLAQLQAMTESVVLHGAAPAKGNQNAINQIRTNEIALAAPWELREFTLTDEQPALLSDLPISGPLRKHTVAQTPNDGVFNPGGDVTIDAFVNGPVTAGLPAGVVVPPGSPVKCSSSYTVPWQFGGTNLRGGNALVTDRPLFGATGAGFWKAAVPPTNDGICARHEFSLNTCHGCHRRDSGTIGFPSTSFTHIDPLSTIPVTLSKFLTGGGPGLSFGVNDTQFGAPVVWQFADLDRRLKRLFELSHCTPCMKIIAASPKFVDVIQSLGPVPADVSPNEQPNLRIGPVTDLATVQKLVDLRAQNAGELQESTADVIRPIATQVH